MHNLTLTEANAIISAAFAKGADLKLKPLGVAVLDAGGHTLAFQRQDGASFIRYEVASGKAYGALAVGTSSRKLGVSAVERPHFSPACPPFPAAESYPWPAACWCDAMAKSSARWAFPAIRRTMMNFVPLPASRLPA